MTCNREGVWEQNWNTVAYLGKELKPQEGRLVSCVWKELLTGLQSHDLCRESVKIQDCSLVAYVGKELWHSMQDPRLSGVVRVNPHAGNNIPFFGYPHGVGLVSSLLDESQMTSWGAMCYRCGGGGGGGGGFFLACEGFGRMFNHSFLASTF